MLVLLMVAELQPNRQQYSYTIENLADGVYVYRLKQLDFDGSFNYSEIIKVEVFSATNFSLNKIILIHLIHQLR